MTRDQFMSMSPQEKWDEYCLLESELAVAEGKLALLDADDTAEVEVVAPQYRFDADWGMSYPVTNVKSWTPEPDAIPFEVLHDPTHLFVDDSAFTGYYLPPSANTSALSPNYRQQFFPPISDE